MPSVTAVKVLMSNNLTRKNQHLLVSAGAREPLNTELELALYVSDCYLLVYLILSRESPTLAPVSGLAKKLEPPRTRRIAKVSWHRRSTYNWWVYALAMEPFILWSQSSKALSQ